MQDARLDNARAAFDAWNRKDLDALVAVFHPDCEVHAHFALAAEPYRGRDGVRRWHQEATESFGGFTVAWQELRPVGDRVLALGTLDLEGTASGIQLRPDIGWVATFDGDLLKTVRVYLTHAEAEAAAGAQ